ncbi:transposable element Tc1 transposase [Trichonephila clavipes]|nr:transposable element Tc1 transposase [Trichonephila clavipes]
MPWAACRSCFHYCTHIGPQLEVKVWGLFLSTTGTPLNVIKVTYIAQKYIDDTLRTVLQPFLLQYLGLIFQQNNATPHLTRVAMNCLKDCQTLPWPVSPPDLSPIEHVWDIIGRRLHLPWNVYDLTQQLEKI